MTKILLHMFFAALFAALFISCAAKGEAVPPSSSKLASASKSVSENEAASDAQPPLTEADKRAARAAEILASMTLEEKVGQMFLAHYAGDISASLQEKYQFGGYILFADNFNSVSKDVMIERINAVQSASKINMLIGADEEGGGINRVSSNPAYRDAPFKSPRQLYAEGGFNLIAADTAEKADFLKSIGINFNLAPVCDVSTNPADYIYYRTLGKDANLTSVYAANVVTVMNQKKIAGALKHFPGYGNNRDTHTGFAYDSRSLESLKQNDLVPFSAGIKAGADCVLVSHNIVSAIDDKNPASLSPVVHELLRKELNFDGVIMTDDLFMGAVANLPQDTTLAVAAILAGNDFLCGGDTEPEIQNVVQAVESGKITESRIDESVLRILRWKLKMEIVA